MDTYYEYEPLFLKKNPIYIRKFVRHSSMGRIHWHEALELLYFTKGKAVTGCNLDHHEVRKGTIVLINGNELHTGIISQIDSEFYCFQFDPSFFHNLIGNEYALFQNIIVDEDCTKILDEMIAVYSQPRTIQSILKYKKLAHEFFEILAVRYVKNVLDEEHYKKQFKRLDTFHHAVNYIEQNYTENISVPELAAHFNMSTSYFSHFFKEYAQKTVVEYLNETRIQNAKVLLEKEETPIKEIALRVGFSDLNYFSRKFKAITGMTAMEYRKNYYKNRG